MSHPEKSRPDRIRWALAIFGLWTLFGFAESNQTYFSMAIKGHHHSWWSIAAWCTLCWASCAFLTPPILYLGRRFPFERPHILRSLIVHFIAFCAFLGIQTLITVSLSHVFLPFKPMNPPDVPWKDYFNWALGETAFGIFTYGTIVMAGYALDYRGRYVERVKREAQLESLLARAEVLSLKMQLQPHFLFNTLNGIVSLVRTREVEAAEKMILNLSSMLRHSLDKSGQQEVPLSEELEFLNFYLDIEQMRFPERLQVVLDVDPQAVAAKVPSLLLQPIVENAIRHGIAPNRGVGRVSICARREGEKLRLEVQDNGVGMPLPWEPASSTGLGLANTAARLRHLYGDAQQFSITAAEGGGTRVTILLPYEVAP